jgi:hypothetical protein
MKVFISWSGSFSQGVAEQLRNWLPLVVASANPYVSSEDIDKGSRWALKNGSELESSAYGIVCVTLETQFAPWIQFEAGALSRRLDVNRVSPLLVGVRPAELDRHNPLLQFQATEFVKADVRKLTHSLNRAAGTLQSPSIVEQQFDTWWDRLEAAVTTLTAEHEAASQMSPTPSEPSRVEQMLEELLFHAREQRRGRASRSRTAEGRPNPARAVEALLLRLASISASPAPEDRGGILLRLAAATEAAEAHLDSLPNSDVEIVTHARALLKEIDLSKNSNSAD